MLGSPGKQSRPTVLPGGWRFRMSSLPSQAEFTFC
jgi:hypothetical protein